ncbi:subclass B1 metallo-beta-lactamase [Sedimentitalea sp. CY04]|uniref:beta-lactamase n=1 Tax=Parasedimentitalea denitrificans TaxID=2211118 RepID=A0ABX0W5D6_9RHOB|nr:subclass B1 metallo-beta-lactamase [Sedimentitalea sp. CY04]NIZ60797.1 subclass B1 metallo-beta-lactamase [Sedimentitalea sp. CY04]
MKFPPIRFLFTAAFCVTTASQAPASDSADMIPVEFKQLSESVWMHTSYKHYEKFGPVPANGLIVAEGTQSILIDSGWTDAQTDAILDWARDDLKQPVTRAYFTHAHLDKMGGVGAVKSRDIETYALELSNELALANGLQPAENDIHLSVGQDVLSVGLVDLFFPGGAHSHDNLVAYVAKDSLLYGGCMVRSAASKRLGNTQDADVLHWDTAIGLVKQRFPQVDIVVPGHGAPAGPELLERTQVLVKRHVD